MPTSLGHLPGILGLQSGEDVKGDEDFLALDVERPEILTISQFAEKYM